MKDEVVAEESVWVLHLQEVDSRLRQFLQLDLHGLVLILPRCDRAGNPPSVHDDVGSVIEMAPANRHGPVFSI